MKTMYLTFCLIFFSLQVAAQETVRIATYNIKFLHENIDPKRVENLKNVLAEVDADVYGLQEIKDRKALELIFPPEEWHIIIDDQSGENQDLAIVARKSFTIHGFSGNKLDADDAHFLFSGSQNNWFFPDRRDILAVELGVPNDVGRFWLLVAHAKARHGGRHTTDSRRVGAAQQLLSVLEREFDERDYVLLGDMNDSPDDASMNILESGTPGMTTMMENDQGEFLINLAEPAFAQDHVSFGRNNANRLDGDRTRISTVEPGIRLLNFDERNRDTDIGDCLFDQILIPHSMLANYTMGSFTIFDGASAVNGNNTTRASDHLPVYADFVFNPEDNDEGTISIVISRLLPNPEGTDSGNEIVTLHNNTGTPIDLTGWLLLDRAENKYPLSGSIPANSSLDIQMTTNSMPLNNSGDDIQLKNDSNATVHQVSYSRNQVMEGIFISF